MSTPSPDETPADLPPGDQRRTQGSIPPGRPTDVPTATPVPGAADRTRSQSWGGSVNLNDLMPGQVVFGKYEVVQELGRGGMGAVWLVRHLQLDAERAIKLIISQGAFDPQARARFRREARAMARFSHPNAVAVHDADVRRDGEAAYIEMEYVRGLSLNKVLRPGVPMPLDWTARVVAQLCDVLHEAHEHGIVHRDLKPSNLMLVEGRPEGAEFLKVLDFGIAKILEGEGRDPDDVATLPGLTLGTPPYMSPEQVASQGPGGLDRRSDIYTVGVILYEVLTGKRPFEGVVHRLIYDHLHTPPAPFAQRNPEAPPVPPEVEDLVLRCLEKDPARRPQTARELAEEFRRLTTVEERPEAPPPPPPPWGLRAAMALVLLAVLGAIAWALRPHITVQAPQELALVAGRELPVPIRIDRDPFAGPVRLIAEDLPPGVTVRPGPAAGTADVAQLIVAADLNAAAGRRPLVLSATAGSRRQTATIVLDIAPPPVYLPPASGPISFTRLPGAKLVPSVGKNFPEKVACLTPDGTQVVFLLIPKQRSSDPEPFYIMENKVWTGLFAEFAAAHPDAAPVWQRADDWGDRLPVMMVTALEAHAFARWLGGLLPSCEQWDKAAGLHDGNDLRGPFLETWDGSDPQQIAVGRDEADGKPLPVGSAAADVSPFGCRDMAGNGLEWTRNSTTPGHVMPLTDSDPTDLIYLRGRRYTKRTPLLFEELRTQGELWPYRQHEPEIGFRVVIEP